MVRSPWLTLVAALREAAQALCGDTLWGGPAGRAASDLLADLEAEADAGPASVEPASLAPLLKTLMDEAAVRPPRGGHPRLAIYGLIEARLQTADLMILGGLNEGTWPGQLAPDPLAGTAHPRRARPARPRTRRRRLRARSGRRAGGTRGADYPRPARCEPASHRFALLASVAGAGGRAVRASAGAGSNT